MSYQSKFTGKEIDAKLDQVGQIASAETLGGIKVGEGLEIDNEGVLKTLINKYKLLENSQISINTVANDYSTMGNRNTFDTSGQINDKSIVKLANGNLFISYKDCGSSNYGKFVIYDQKGNSVKSAVTFSNRDTGTYIQNIVLDNTNVMILYRDNSNGYGKFVIYDQNGNLVKSETTFCSNNMSHFDYSVKLNNGNVIMVFGDDTNSYGKFVIYDQNGNLVKSETTFCNNSIVYITATILKNNNVFIAYRDYGDNYYGNFVIYDQDGNIVKSETIFSTTSCSNLGSVTLDNGNVMLIYRNAGDNDYGKFIIYDQDGNIVKSATPFDGGKAHEPKIVILPNSRNVFICYKDADNNYYGTFEIHNQNGDLILPATVFDSTECSYLAVCALDNGNVIIGYSMSSVSDDGYFKIIGSGDIITYKKDFTLNDLNDLEIGQHIRVWNNTPNVDDVVKNTLNDVEINAVLNVGYYDLVYDGEVFEATKVQDESGIIEVSPTPIATSETLGGIKVGQGLEITEDGVLSALGGKGTVTVLYEGSGLTANGNSVTLSDDITDYDGVVCIAGLGIGSESEGYFETAFVPMPELNKQYSVSFYFSTNAYYCVLFKFTDSKTLMSEIVQVSGTQWGALGIKKVYGIKLGGGSNGGDTTPVGNIISFMGTIAPDGYLTCDGAVLNVADYSRLASHFETQFGSKNYFGGDGTTTFAVPDLRNEFLRGYHGNKEEQLSDEIGIHQDATKHNNIYVSNYGKGLYSPNYYYADTSDPTHSTNSAKNQDSVTKLSDLGTDTSKYNISIANLTISTNTSYSESYANYTSRPTNVAVLYCIKY